MSLKYFFAFVVICISAHAFAMPAEIILIRHAEKPEKGDELSPRGWERARALPKLFTSRPEFRIPEALFAMAPDGRGSSVRAIQTLKFVASEFGLLINKDYTRDEFSKLVARIEKDHSLDGKIVVICWEHKVLEKIAAAFGVSPKPNYPGERFDLAWKLEFTAPNASPTFTELPERLLSGDAQD